MILLDQNLFLLFGPILIISSSSQKRWSCSDFVFPCRYSRRYFDNVTLGGGASFYFLSRYLDKTCVLCQMKFYSVSSPALFNSRVSRRRVLNVCSLIQRLRLEFKHGVTDSSFRSLSWFLWVLLFSLFDNQYPVSTETTIYPITLLQ